MSEEGLRLSRELAAVADEVAALTNLGWAALLADDLERAPALAEEAIALGRTIGDAGGVARALLITGLAAVAVGDHEHALELHEESLALARKAGDEVAAVLSLGTGVFAYLGRGAIRPAQALCAQGLAISPQPRIANALAFQWRAAAALAAAQGLPVRSARLWGAAESLQETIGAAHSSVELRVHGPYMQAARGKLGEVAWEAALAEGKAMTVEEAEAYAESEERVPPRRVSALKAPQQGEQHDQGLTHRQREIALLVAQGLSNRQIASELTISENTVANHVAGIARKLQAPSRSRIAVWVTERGLREVS
jgi:non-specific serine/threonine protein kinase